MSTPASAASQSTQLSASEDESRSPWFPEGGIVPVLHVALIALAAFGVQAGGWSNLVIPVGVVGLAAAIFGTAIAKVRLVDSLAHLLSLIAGIGIVFSMVLVQADALGLGLRDRIRPLVWFLVDWYLGKRPPDEHEGLLISMLMGLIVWLIGYLASWILFRRGWLFVGIALPGFLLLINLGYAPDPKPWLVPVMAAIAIPLVARYTLYQRQQRWQRQRLVGPAGLASKLLVISTVVALVLTTGSWRAPERWSQSVFQPIAERLGSTVSQSRQQINNWLEQTGGETREDIAAGPYTSFDDAFSIGGPIHLSDQPEVLVRNDSRQAPYLAAHRYDVYTGSGWMSSVEETFENEGADGKLYAPELTFREGQDVVLSAAVTSDRVEESTEITPLNGNTSVLLSTGTYLSSDIRTAVRMPWRHVQDEPYPLSHETFASLPPDVQGIASLLIQSDLSAEAGPSGPQAIDPADRLAIEGERSRLSSRFLDVRWTATADGVVDTLFITGQLPVYDDVEAVFPRSTPGYGTGDPYVVTGLVSTADAQTLAGASPDYPQWVADRYLQMSETITPRTIQLAMDLAAGVSSPYDKAVIIEDYLRGAIVYDQNVSAPPDGRDVVDYVLFDDPRGYCEHYASAMTVMMRALGVPARTVVGYYPGTFDESQGGYLYLQRNAHAWTEVYFEGYGWIAFEPTAGRPLPDRNVAMESTEQPTPTVQPTSEPSPTGEPNDVAATPVLTMPAVGPTNAPQMTPLDDDGNGGRWIFAGVAAVIAAAVAGFMWLSWNRGLGGLSPSAALFERLRRIGGWAGVSAGSTTTPREFANAFSQRVPAGGKSARQIVQVYELDQYGPEGADSRLVGGATEAWRRIRSQIPRMLLRRPRR